MIEQRCIIGRAAEIGRSGEHAARTMVFSIGSWLRQWPDTQPRLLAQRPGDAVPYPAKTQLRGEELLWTVTRYDTERPGEGVVYIAFIGTQEDVVGVTPPTPTRVRRGPEQIDADTPLPLLPPWMQQVVELSQAASETAKTAGDAAQAASEAAQAAAKAAQTAADGAQAAVADGLGAALEAGQSAAQSAERSGGSAQAAAQSAQSASASAQAAAQESALAAAARQSAEDAAKRAEDAAQSGPATASGGIIYTILGDTTTEPVTAAAYADEACTTMLTFEEGKRLIIGGATIVLRNLDMDLYALPALSQFMDDAKAAVCFIYAGEALQILTVFSDSLIM